MSQSSNDLRVNLALLEQLIKNSKKPVSESAAVPVPVMSLSEYQKELERARQDALGMTLSQFHRSYILTAYSSIYTRVSTKLQKVICAVDNVRDFYLVESILSQITDDALSPKIGSEDIVKFSHPDVHVNAFLQVVKKRTNLDQLIENLTPDLCAYGEYVVETVVDAEKKQGVTDLIDGVDQGKVITLLQDGRATGYLVTDEVDGTIVKKELADYIKFSIGGQRIKVRFDDSLPMMVRDNPKLKAFFKKAPRYIRIGRSLLYPALGKIKELELLEKLVPATKINKLSQGNLVGISVPESLNLDAGMNAALRIENMINKAVTVDQEMKEITVEAILSSAGRTRVIPIFGDKGRLEKFDYKSDDADDAFTNVKELRDVICDSIGVPAELIFKSDATSKAETLKRYAKYLRKLKRIQKAILDGCRQLVAIHLANSGFSSVDPSTVEITMQNSLVEIDNLDKLEHADVTISFLKNIKDFFIDISSDDSPFKSYVRMASVVNYMEDSLKTIGLADAIKTKEEVDADKRFNTGKTGKENAFVNTPFDPSEPPEEEGLDPEGENDVEG